MRKVAMYLAILAVALIATSALAQDKPAPQPIHPVNTYSIVCFDPVTGEFGAAVQSHWFKVADVIWVKPGVGAVATQSLADFAYGPIGLEMMQNGRSAGDALVGALASDGGREVRQVAMIDADGNVVAHTGTKCIAEAGHHVGENYSVQANLMRNNTVWDAMAEAFENTDGDLADRMMAALEAAQAEGGDIRGMQSAAMVVVSGDPTGMPWRDRLVDIRVDDSPEPLTELRRLLNITRAYDLMNRGDELLAEEDFDGAAEAYAEASRLAPSNLEILYWHAVTLATVDQLERALPIFKDVFEKDESWRILTPRLVDSDLLPNDSAMLEQIMAQ